MSTPNPVSPQPGRFRKLITAPVYAGDEDKTRRAQILNAILWIELATMAVGVLFLPFATNVLTGMLLILGFLTLAITGLVLLHKGFINFTSLLLSICLYAAATALVLVSGGVFSPLTSGYIVVMSVAGLLLNKRAFFSLGGLSLASVLGIALLQAGGLTLPVLIDFSSPMQTATAIVGTAFTAVLLFYLAVSSLSDALARANQSNRDLEMIQSSLEERVEARTAQLRASADVGRVAVSILDTNQLLREVVNLITNRFGFYYTAVFLADSTNKWAVLREATGNAGRVLKERQHQLEIGGRSMVGSAMKTRQARIALDIGDEAVRFANPLLPDTRSEIALPLMVGSRVIGALDVQSTEMAAFDAASASVLQTMSDQIAIALSNTMQFQQAQAGLQRTRQLYDASVAISNADDASSILRELMTKGVPDADAAQILMYGPRDEAGQYAYFDVAAAWSHTGNERVLPAGARVGSDQVPPMQVLASEPYLIRDADDPATAPAQQQVLRSMEMRALLGYALVAGSQPVGVLMIMYREPRLFMATETQPLQALTGQVAVTLRNQQLVREEASAVQQLDEINRRLTSQVWDEYVHTTGAVTYKEDVGPSVRNAGSESAAIVLSAPITIHGEEVGVLRLEDATADRAWTPSEIAIAQAVAGEVAIALENARLIEETEKRAQRERTINRITSRIRNASSIPHMLTVAAQELRAETGAVRSIAEIVPEAAGQEDARL